jgi:hypothetical protein
MTIFEISYDELTDIWETFDYRDKLEVTIGLFKREK